jgi:hypothetical protein
MFLQGRLLALGRWMSGAKSSATSSPIRAIALVENREVVSSREMGDTEIRVERSPLAGTDMAVR